uniref:Uncharacterized protein n=1 Tax=Anthurium amnicola TaxID=1678845 RepID=A0A1D1ZJ49_9ARAE
MGSCLSKKGSPTGGKKRRAKKGAAADGCGPPPLVPSPPEEEAVVKEVLTETPHPSAVAKTLGSSRRAEATDGKPPGGVGSAPPASAVNGCGRCDGDGGSEEASEICSASEGFSVSTTLTEKRDAEEETAASRKGAGAAPSRCRHPEWYPAGKGLHRRTRSSSGELPSKGGRSPAKRSDGRPFPARDAAVARQRAAGAVRRRSESPAAKREGLRGAGGGGRGGGNAVSRSSSRGKAARGRASPGRPRREPEVAGNSGRMEGAGATEVGREEEGERASSPLPGTKETLENPMVSLECFIFL